MRQFIQRHRDQILGFLSGFDRLRLRGTLRLLTSVGGMMSYLSLAGVLIKDFMGYAEELTKRLRQNTEENAQAAGRPVRYLPGATRKDELIQKIRREEGLAADGLIAVLSTLENCYSYDIYRNRSAQQVQLRRRPRKCLHYYFYFMDDTFGLTQVRLQTWFPFNVHVVLNGREWLARQLDAAGIGYQRRDNCFVDLEDFARAQQLADRQPRIAWPKHLQRLLDRVHPLHQELFAACPGPYYWTSEQSEWATDVAFRSTEALGELYRTLIQHGIKTFQSPDVMRFLGHKVPAHGGVNGHFAGQVVSDLKHRPEGVRIKHRLGRNSLKMYDKQGSVLRVETTLNDVRGLKVFRHRADQPQGQREWLPLRKGVADMSRRVQLSHSANRRYLQALSKIDAHTPLSRVADKLCQPAWDERGRRHRALNPLAAEDAQLLAAVARGEFHITGFRNRDVRRVLFGEAATDVQRRRDASRVTRKLALLRAHGLIRKVPGSHRYLLTSAGQTAIPALLATRNATIDQLTPAA
jgi:hypothetical protein